MNLAYILLVIEGNVRIVISGGKDGKSDDLIIDCSAQKDTVTAYKDIVDYLEYEVVSMKSLLDDDGVTPYTMIYVA